MKTLQERYRVALEDRGETFVKALRGCVVMTRGGSDKYFYFLGKAGSVRVGPNRTTSRPVSDKFKALLLSPVGIDDLGI